MKILENVAISLFISFLLNNLLLSENRPWGSYQILTEEKNYKVKKIVVLPKKRISLQKHKYRAEHWIIVKGKGIATLNDKQVPVQYGSVIDVKKGSAHRIENIGEIDLEFIEVQTG